MSDFFIKDLILKMNGINEEIQQSLAMKVRSLLLLIYSSTNSNVLAKGLTLLLNDSVYPMIASMIFYYRCFYSNVSPGEGFTGVIVKRKKNLVYYFMAISVQKIIAKNDFLGLKELTGRALKRTSLLGVAFMGVLELPKIIKSAFKGDDKKEKIPFSPR